MKEETAIPRLIVGSGRSGTTWVLDCVADANGLRPVFEPLHPLESKLGSRFAYQVLLAGDQEDVLEQFFKDLAAGQVRSRWLDYRGRREHLFPSPTRLTTVNSLRFLMRKWRKYYKDRKVLKAAVKRERTLIKCIRANWMASWLTRTVGFRTVLVVRHPGAVIESQFRLGSVWDPIPVLKRYRGNMRFHEVTSGRYLNLLNSNLTTLQALTLNWVIENQWPVEHSQTNGYAVTYFEDLMLWPDTSWRYLCNALDLPRSPALSLLLKPSQQASTKSVESGGSGRQVPSWRSRMTSAQLETIQGILDATECDLYHVDVNEPLRPNAAGVT